jgi:hypothetical protein
MIEEPVVDESGVESHPGFGKIGASRCQAGGPGITLFDSDIRHSHTVRVRISGATRRRDLNHDWIYSSGGIVEVELSEAQWASFVSSMNVGDGVPCSIRAIQGQMVPGFPHSPRLAQSMQETQGAAQRAFERIQEAMAAVDALDPKAPVKERREALNWLRSSIANAVPNVTFATKSLIEQTEDVVTKARADVEAFVVTKARQLGLDVEAVAGGNPLAISGPEGEE